MVPVPESVVPELMVRGPELMVMIRLAATLKVPDVVSTAPLMFKLSVAVMLPVLVMLALMVRTPKLLLAIDSIVPVLVMVPAPAFTVSVGLLEPP